MIFVYEFSLPAESTMTSGPIGGSINWFTQSDRRNRHEFNVSIPGESSEYAPLFNVPKHATFGAKARRSLKGVKMIFDDPLLGTTQVQHRRISVSKLVGQRKKELEFMRGGYKASAYRWGNIYQSNLCQEIVLPSGTYEVSGALDIPPGVSIRGSDFDGDTLGTVGFTEHQAMIQSMAMQRLGRTEQMRRVVDHASFGEMIHQETYSRLVDELTATRQTNRPSLRYTAWDFDADTIAAMTDSIRNSSRNLYYSRGGIAASSPTYQREATETTSNHPVTDQRNPPRRQHGPRNRNQHW